MQLMKNASYNKLSTNKIMDRIEQLTNYTNFIKDQLFIILSNKETESYSLKDIPFSLLEQVCRDLSLELKEMDKPEGWSLDYTAKIINMEGKDIWWISGSLRYCDMQITKL